MHDDLTTYIEQAINWALAHMGDTSYRGLCLAFVEDAYEQPNNLVLDGYSFAKEAAERYAAAPDGPPPRGTFVFYDCAGTINGTYQNWGHVGLSLGDERIVHALAEVRVDTYLAVEDLPPAPGWTPFRYIGWATLPAIFKGVIIRHHTASH